MTNGSLFVILGILVCVSGFFSGAETGMMALNRYRLRHLVRKKHRLATHVSKLLQRTDRLLSIILIGNTCANLFASAVATIISVRLLGDAGVAVGTAVLTIVVLVFAEIMPKTVAAVHPQRVAFFAAIPLRILLKLLLPLVWLANGSARIMLRLLGLRLDNCQSEHLSGEELRTVVHETGSLIPVEHKEMLLSVLDLEKVTVDDIMISRQEIVGIDLQESWDEILETLENSQHTRLPIFKDTIDAVQGFVHLRRVLNLLAHDKLNLDSLQLIVQEPYFIPQGTPLSTQLLNFKKEKRRSALVVDEYGDIQGLVTIEDILEEIVGEFTTDLTTIGRDILPQDDGSYLVDGSITVRELNRDMNYQLPLSGPKTLSGLIIDYLEFIPPSALCLKIAGVPMEILQVKDNLVRTVKLLPIPSKTKKTVSKKLDLSKETR